MVIQNNLFEVYENVLGKDDYEYCLNTTLRSSNWMFGGQSDESGSVVFWYNDLSKDPFYTDKFLGLINKITNNKFKINRVYANGQTFGLPGNFHTDDTSPQAYTFLYYVNPVWSFNWGGNTVFSVEGNLIQYPFTPNAGILFKSNVFHAGLDPTRHANDLRVTVAFKLFKDEDDV